MSDEKASQALLKVVADLTYRYDGVLDRATVEHLDWDLPDPHELPLEVVRGIRDRIDTQVQQLLGELLPATSTT